MSVGDILSRVGTMLGGAGPSTSGGASGSGRPNRELSYGEKKANAKETLPWEYLNGYKSLTTVLKDAFRDLFGADIDTIKNIDALDNYFKNMIFTLLYKNRQDDEGKLIWENRKSYSKNLRDIFVGRALNDLLEEVTGNRNMTGSLAGFARTLVGRYRDSVNALLQKPATRRANQLFEYMQSLDSNSKKKLVNLFDSIASESSNLYKEYKDDSDKINFSDSLKLRLLAEFLANLEIGGGKYAGRGLYNSIADELASNLGFFEKTWNAGNQFVNSFAGDIITAVGMLTGAVHEGVSALTGHGHSDWFLRIINNDITTYGELLAETNTWDPSELERLSKLGLNDNPIFSSAAQQELLLSWNTPFELEGSAGYTVGSTVLSGASAKVITGLPKAYRTLKDVSKLTKTALGMKSLERASLYARTMQRALNLTLKSVPAIVGTTEGAVNAGLTYREVLREKTDLVYENIRNRALQDIELYVKNNPGAVADYYRSKGYNIPTKEGNRKNIELYSDDEVSMLTSIALLDEDLVNLAASKYSLDILEDLKAAEKSADQAMTADFIINSFINGALNYATKLTLMSPTVRKAFSKNVNSNKLLEENGIDIINKPGAIPKAVAKKYTKMDAVKSRAKEAFGEGAEEGLQSISSAFSEGYGSNMFNSYLHNKYVLNLDAQLALETSFLANMAYGAREAVDATLSLDTWRDALYGGLSVALGMPQPKASSMYGKSDNLANTSKNWFLKVTDKIPFGYRSMFAPLVNDTEVNAVNKQRKEIEDRINGFLLKSGTPESLFNIANTAKFIELKEKAAKNGDEMLYRDAEFGELFSLAVTLNTLEGTDYYDSVITMLLNTANLDELDLSNPDSLTSQAVAEYLNFAKENYGTEVDNNEALLAVKSNASKLLSTIEQAKAEYRNVEKMFGENLDADIKLGIMYQRLASLDHKKRLNQLQQELDDVTKLLQEDDEGFTSLSSPILKLMALHGSISRAKEVVEHLLNEKLKIDEELKALKELKLTGGLGKLVYNRRKKALLKMKLGLNGLISSIENAIEDYTSKYGSINEDGTVTTPESLVLSAATIMLLDPESRAIILNELNRDSYSQELLLEIDKVNRIGVLTFLDFLEKIADSGALDRRYRNSLGYLLLMMRDKEMYTREANRFKTNALAKLLERQYSYLIDLEEQGRYEEFARAIDKIIGSGDVVALKAVDGLLLKTKSEFYKRYSTERNNLDRLIADLSNGNIKSFEDLDDNSQRMFSMTLLYLLNKGIDLNDPNAAVAALSELDAEGNSLFENYVNSFYPEKDNTLYVNRVEFTSTGEVILNYKNVMLEYNAQLKERANNAKPTEVSSTPQSKSAPPTVPSVEENFLSLGTLTADEGTKRDKEAQEEGVVEDPVIEAYKANSGEKVAQLAKFGTNVINNSSDLTLDAESKLLALLQLQRLSDTKFETQLDYIDAINQSATKLDTESEDNNDANGRAANLLRGAAAKMLGKVDKESPKLTKPEATLQALTLPKKGSTPVLMGPTINPNSNLLQTLPIAWMRRNFPNHPIVKYYDTYRIEEFLTSSLMPSNPTVMFISDRELNDAIMLDLKARGLEYSNDNLSLIAVIEVPSGGITINVDGVDKHFQPIGIMPKTGNQSMSGSNRLGKIRSLINLDNMGQLLRDEQGNIITTTIYGLIKITSPRHIPSTYPNRQVIDVQISDSSLEDKEKLESVKKAQRRNNPIYLRLQHQFLSKLKTKQTPRGTILYYPVDNPFGSEPFEIPIFTTPIHLTRARGSNMLISELFNSNDVEAALKANSRIKRAANALHQFFKSRFTVEDLEFEHDASGNLVPSKSTAAKLNSLAEALGKEIGNYLRLPGNGGWKYTISPTSEVMLNGRRLFTLSIVNDNGSTIQLGKVTLGEMTAQTLFNILKNLIMDGASVRMSDSKQSFIKWNVPYSDFLKDDLKAKDNAVDMYYDGILDVSYESFKFLVEGLALNSPFTLEGSSNFVLGTLVSNLDNAQPTTPLNQPVIIANDQATTSGGTIVDSESGAVLEGKSALTTQASINVTPIVDSIVANSKIIKLSEDGKYYINTKTGKRYARVTSIIQADEQAGERLPSTISTKEGIELKKKFEDVKKLYAETDGTYQELADKIFDLCAELGFNIKTVTPTELGAPKGFEDAYAVAGDFHLETSTLRINKNARDIAKRADTPLGQLLLHEAIHALTTYAISNKDNLSKAAQDAVTTIEAVYAKLKELYPDNSLAQFSNDFYGLKNSKEMIAELANPNFRELLKKHSLFDKITDSIKTILNELFNTNFVTKGTLEENLLKSLDTLINNFNKNAFIENNKSVLGLRWAKDNMEAVSAKKETIQKLAESYENKEAVTLESSTKIVKYITSKGYKEGDLMKVSTGSSFGIVRLNRLSESSIIITPIDPHEAGLELANKGNIPFTGLITTQQENPWVTPSTNIETGIDELVRDFFAGKLKDNYPNIGKNQADLFVSQLQGLKNSLDAQGLTVIPRDIVATGSIEVTDSEGKKYTIDVAGTLDLLAYDGKGNFYIFDMKTHHSANVDGKIDKWRRQLTLYKTFLESQYGIKVKELNVIPIKVEYPTPKGVGNSTNEFTVKEGNLLLLNGKEFTGANPNLGTTITLNPIELNVLFDNLTEEEKKQSLSENDASVSQVSSEATTPTETKESETSQQETKPIEKIEVKEEENGISIDPIVGLGKAKSKDLRTKKKGNGGAVKKPVERLTPIPAKYQWGKFENYMVKDEETGKQIPIDVDATVENLIDAGYTLERWNNLPDEEMKKALECAAV